MAMIIRGATQMNTNKYRTIFLTVMIAALPILAAACASQQVPVPAQEGQVPAEEAAAPAQEVQAPAEEAAQDEAAAEPAAQTGDKWCSGVTIRYFVGGDAGDAFASIVHKGALAAEADLGPTVEYVFFG